MCSYKPWLMLQKKIQRQEEHTWGSDLFWLQRRSPGCIAISWNCGNGKEKLTPGSDWKELASCVDRWRVTEMDVTTNF
jgi:hypothetical protein